jgi:cytidylate kinase
MIVTIDGPAGAGKSTVARALAKRLGFRFLDTGAMYRVVALAAVKHRIDCSDPNKLAELAETIAIEFDHDRVLLDGEDVTDAIRSSHITALVRNVADNVRVREHLVCLQQRIGRSGNIVTEGRDQGTLAFPEAECKIFLTASPEERARRRIRDLRAQGETPSFEEILAQQTKRDREDAARRVGGLVKAENAKEVSTDGLNFDEVVDRLEEFVREVARNDMPVVGDCPDFRGGFA